ncbi:MAG: hypothetical protein QGH60_14290 [Phycisphaerae bacterium]|jgi:hypothetical protein|nr:hypothetical protein [Phycisphaerae bacterium]
MSAAASFQKLAVMVLLLTSAAAGQPVFAPPRIALCGRAAPKPSSAVCGFSLIAGKTGPQAALMGPELLASIRANEDIEVVAEVSKLGGPFSVSVRANLSCGAGATVRLALDGGKSVEKKLLPGVEALLELPVAPGGPRIVIRLKTRGATAEAAVRWRDLRLRVGGREFNVPICPPPAPNNRCPPPVMATMRPPVEEALIEWDWRMQDGIGTRRIPDTYPAAVARTLKRGDKLIGKLRGGSVLQVRWEKLRARFKRLSATRSATRAAWEDLWRRVHRARREIVLSNPLARLGGLVFVKRTPAVFSHQLTQYYGSSARPGGGVFVLESPGKSMRCRELTAALPQGSYQHPEVSFDGRRVLFAYCPAKSDPANRHQHLNRFYHLHEISATGSGLRQLTKGPFDDFSPRRLPDGRIVFISTRRGGFHRCGRGPCPVYTLTVADADGSNPRVISFHETHEWDPAVLHDGRVIYTRWDYVDRNAVHYQQLWSVRPDGTNVRIFYGNNTFNPVGIWEARAIPGSRRVMATAAAHHAITAGSIILLDINKGIDGMSPITRLTGDALFPESEAPVTRSPTGRSGNWSTGALGKTPVPPEAKRWPGHCYRSAYPLSEEFFLAAYSFDALVGEPERNPVNMFGLYLVDRFGNKELLYRDLNIGSLWPAPLRPRGRPEKVPCILDKRPKRDGTFFVQNVYRSWPALPKETITHLRIVQVLPKTTPNMDQPPVGAARGAPGKQVLGTVPVERDGSACFRAPSGVALAFQALDTQGRAVQIMRSLTYLQPGETVSCIGCHEYRTMAPPTGRRPLASLRRASKITPGPDGSNPLSYPILVQPVLDKHCVRCHNPKKPDGKVVLTGEPKGRYTVSYNALVSRVSYSSWGRGGNIEGRATKPGFYGARGSGRLMKTFAKGHYRVKLTPGELSRVVTWMDANALFYGTFDPKDQARQQRGQRIAGPALE